MQPLTVELDFLEEGLLLQPFGIEKQNFLESYLESLADLSNVITHVFTSSLISGVGSLARSCPRDQRGAGWCSQYLSASVTMLTGSFPFIMRNSVLGGNLTP